MTNRPSPSASPSSARAVSPLQAARKRLGLRQNDVAELIGVPVSSYIPWDQGRRQPQDPRVCQAIAEALQTTSDVLWPPDSNPVIGPKLRELRAQQAAARTLADDAQQQQATVARLGSPEHTGSSSPTQPPSATYGIHREIEATLVGADHPTPSQIRTARRSRRTLIPAAASIAAVVAAGTAIATTAGNDSVVREAAPVARAGTTAAERERVAQQAALAQAKDRGDYDAAITVAARLNDTSTVGELRYAAGDVFARRARQAAERGDLSLATSRLDRAEDRYGDSPAINAVRRRIDQIADARKDRAAKRKRAAKKRAVARARAAAAARRRAAAPSSPVLSASPSPTQRPVTPSQRQAAPTPSQPAPAPAPARPAPRPSAPAPSRPPSSGGSGSGGGTVDPGLF